MGLFGGGNSKSSANQRTDTANTNVQDSLSPVLSGVQLEKGSTLSLVTTDPGAIQAAEEIVASGFDAVNRYAELVREGDADNLEKFQWLTDAAERSSLNAQASALEMWNRAGDTVELAIENAARSGGEALDFGRDAFDFAARSQQLSADSFGGVAAEALASAREQTGSVIEAFGDFASQSADQVLSAISAIQARESTNSEARLEGVTNKALIIGGVVAAVSVIGFVFVLRRRG